MGSVADEYCAPLSPAQSRKYVLRDEAAKLIINHLTTFGSTAALGSNPVERFRQMRFICDFNSTVSITFEGDITMEAMDGVLAYISFCKTLLEKALEYPTVKKFTADELLRDFVELVGQQRAEA